MQLWFSNSEASRTGVDSCPLSTRSHLRTGLIHTKDQLHMCRGGESTRDTGQAASDLEDSLVALVKEQGDCITETKHQWLPRSLWPKTLIELSFLCYPGHRLASRCWTLHGASWPRETDRMINPLNGDLGGSFLTEARGRRITMNSQPNW